MTPYRDGPQQLGCPRCGERLERAIDGVMACVRCAGLWIEEAVLDMAFGSPKWPGGASAWWRVELACPMCALEGKEQDLVPFMSNDVLVDRCAGHGLWLDAGELGRLMNTPASDELAALQRKLGDPSELQAHLQQQRESARRHAAIRSAAKVSARERVVALEQELESLRGQVRAIEQLLAAARRELT